jgi:CRP/FNR family transcriptional regulator
VLEDDGLIARRRREIQILNQDELEDI